MSVNGYYSEVLKIIIHLEHFTPKFIDKIFISIKINKYLLHFQDKFLRTNEGIVIFYASLYT